ncbi:MAG TPA: hypothetical protein VF713_16880 [Thermoanaerobaculia bacterium]
MKRLIVAAVVMLNAVVLVHLAGGVLSAVVFAVFVAAFLLPACVLVMRLPFLRAMPPDLRLTAASAGVAVLIVPWFFVRKLLSFAPAIADIALCAILTIAAAKLGGLRIMIEELRPSWTSSRLVVSVVLPVLFALAWLGYEAPAGASVMFHGLFAIDFGNLVSILATLRASPLLPLAHVTDLGPLNYHWLYFALPATLADFCGAAIPACNALILTNLVMAALLVHTLAAVIAMFHPQNDRRTGPVAMAVALFAPFTVYYYQTAAARFSLGWLAMPTRNHLMLSPVNSMIVFGNNTFALVLSLFTAMQVERWNRERRTADLILGTAALSMVIGYSVTLLFPLVAALLIWLALGRIARPLVVLAWAVVSGGAAAAMFLAIHVLSSTDSRHAAVVFDRGQFLRMVILGMLPLWGLLFMAGRRALTFFHVLIVVAVAVPSLLYIAGSSTGQVDFSIKTASLLAIAFAPLIAETIEKWLSGSLPRWQTIVAAILVTLGAIETSAYILQFPYYRMTDSESRGVAIPADYYRSLVWIRDHTPQRSILIDPGGLTIPGELPATWIAERRAWLPTPYTESFLVSPPGSSVPRRAALLATFMRDPGNAAAGIIAGEADYLVSPREVQSPFWTPVSRSGVWVIYRSVVRS